MGNIQRKAWPVLVVSVATLLFAVLSMPVAAQETDLSATIRASLLTDPRAQNLSAKDFESMVQALTVAAAEQGLTAEDIQWRPEEPEPEIAPQVMDTCGGLPTFLCILNESLGFSSGNLLIPILLFLGSIALLFVLGLMIKTHHKSTSKASTPMSSSGANMNPSI